MKYRHTEEEYRSAAAESRSLAEMCRKLGILARGGNFGTLKAKIVKYDIDISHFLGQGWNKENYSVSPANKVSIKKKLIRDRGHQCERCRNTEWLEEPIVLELEHVDGDNQNNVESNLLLLCPNCHSLTPTWKNKNRKMGTCECGKRKHTRERSCAACREERIAISRKTGEAIRKRTPKPVGEPNFCRCGKRINAGSKRCNDCQHEDQQRIQWPDHADLLAMIQASNFSAVSRQLGVSDNAIRKRLAKHPA